MEANTREMMGQVIDEEGLTLAISAAAVAYMNFLVESRESGQQEKIIESILINVSAGYATVKSKVEYENLTLTPWDLLESSLILFPPQFAPPKLSVEVMINGESFIHELNMDTAMGILLFAKTAEVNFQMIMYGTPVTYFNEGEDDIYLRYDKYPTEDESSLRMEGSERRYYFFGTDFLQGIKTAAGWFGLDHHAYWNDLRDIDGNQLDFLPSD